MNYEEDLDLATRLRRISAEPEPDAPSTIYGFLDRVAVSGPVGAPDVRRGFLRLSIRRSQPRSFTRLAAVVGVAAVLVVALSGTLLLTIAHRSSVTATPRYPDLWSALEWQDITATGFPPASSPGGGSTADLSIVTWRGAAYANKGSDGSLWSSTDGIGWQKIASAPALDKLLATPDVLLGQSTAEAPCQLPDSSGVVQPSTCQLSSVVWNSRDGLTWNRSSLEIPAGDAITSWAAIGSTVVVLAGASDYGTGDPAKQTSLAYVSTGGSIWHESAMPDDMSGAINCGVVSTRAGFVVSGVVVDPAGPVQISGSNVSMGSFEIHGYQRSWASADGLNWSVYQGSAAGTSVVSFGLGSEYAGSRGDVMPDIGYSTDGTHWLRDSDGPFSALGQVTGQLSFSSNGSQVVACGDGPSCLVTLGDGRWQALQNGGTVSSLPRQGQGWVIEGGVLWDAGGRLYFGRAVTGVTLRQTIEVAAAPTPTPFTEGPTPPPLPTVSLTPVSKWSGTGNVVKLPAGPIGADQVVAWVHGFVALKNGPSGGHIQVWSSKDGLGWVAVPQGTFTGSTGQLTAIGDSVMLATWNDGNNIWFSSDGVDWARTTIGNPPIGDLPMAGSGLGMVAAMDEPEGQVMYLASPDGQWYGMSIPGAVIQTSKSIALSGSRWVLVGKMSNPKTGDWVPASWSSSDAANWKETTVTGADGQGFLSIVAGRDGFVAVSMATDSSGNASGLGTRWSSPDGSTWTKLTTPLGADATLTGDGNHMIGCQVDSGRLACWSSINGQTWTPLTFGADVATLADWMAPGANLRAFPVGDGVLIVTTDGAWYASAVVQK
jgi:hypothetical protein